MADLPDLGRIVGRVTEIDVGGRGPNSAQLEFSITPTAGPPSTYVVEFDTVPQVFAAMTSLLITAYQTKLPVAVTYSTAEKGTPKATNVKLPGE